MPLRDLAFAGRTLRKSPIFAFTCRANHRPGRRREHGHFSVTNAVLLRHFLSKSRSARIIPTDMHNPASRTFPFSNANFVDLREATKDEFQGLARVHVPFTLTGDDGMPEQVHMGFVTTNYFQL